MTEGPERRFRFVAEGSAGGAVLDLIQRDTASIGRQGAGSIHHVAFRAESDAVQADWREKLRSLGYDVTPQIDREYFNAIYFHEPGGVLFEIATDTPGFTVDEPMAQLGEALKLPAQFEPQRDRITQMLSPITLPKRRIA